MIIFYYKILLLINPYKIELKFFLRKNKNFFDKTG